MFSKDLQLKTDIDVEMSVADVEQTTEQFPFIFKYQSLIEL